jgi:hypothetical protein
LVALLAGICWHTSNTLVKSASLFARSANWWASASNAAVDDMPAAWLVFVLVTKRDLEIAAGCEFGDGIEVNRASDIPRAVWR